MNWRTGPYKWQFSAYLLVFSSLHIVAAMLWEGPRLILSDCMPLYIGGLGLTTAGAVALHIDGRRYPTQPDEGGGKE